MFIWQLFPVSVSIGKRKGNFEYRRVPVYRGGDFIFWVKSPLTNVLLVAYGIALALQLIFESCEGIYFLRGCAGGSDCRERKATPKGVFGRTRKRQVRGLGGTPTREPDSHTAPGAACWGFPKPLLNTEFHSVAARSCGTLFTCLRR